MHASELKKHTSNFQHYLQQGDLARAGQIIKQLLADCPTLSIPYQMAGMWMQHQNRHEEALPYYLKGIEYEPKNYNLLCFAGHTYMALGDDDKAKEHYEQALAINPHYIDALIGLGQYFMHRDASRAITCFSNVLAQEPQHIIAQQSLSMVHYHAGELAEFEATALAYIQAHPHDYALRDYLSSYYFSMEKWDELYALSAQTASIENIPAYMRAVPVVSELLAHYVNGTTNTLPSHTEIAKHIEEGVKHNKIYNATRNLFLFFNHLIEFQADHADLFATDEANATLRVIGESHSLGLARVNISTDDGIKHCQTHMVTGMKAFHLGKEGPNMFKEVFAHKLRLIPEDADIMLTIGEIDCRADEGILHHALKRNTSYEELAQKTATDYMDHVHHALKNRKNRVLVANVNPVSSKLIAHWQEQQQQHMLDRLEQEMDVIDLFNKTLEEKCAEYGFQLVDIYNEAKDHHERHSDKNAHLDFYHLKPTLSKNAIEKAYGIFGRSV